MDDDDKRQRLKEIQTTRPLTCWADHSTIAGHTYVLYTIGCLYDAAVFFTQDELNQNGIDINIEETLSKPLIHIIARCGRGYICVRRRKKKMYSNLTNARYYVNRNTI